VKILSTTTFTTKDLEKHLGSVTTIAVATALIKTPIKQIEEDLLNKIEELTKEISELLIGKAKVLDFVQRKIRAKAPNLCNLLSEAVAANLLSAAGSLEALSIMPACNIQVLGLVREGLPGSSSLNKFKSFLSYSPFVIRAGQHRKKAVRMIAGKAALAARVDRFQQSTNGDMGLQLLQQLQTSFEKSLEVDLNQLKKPLPVPSEFKKSKRGGKRIRAAKKRFEISEIRKDLNRVEFGVEAQEEFRDTGFTFGMLGKSGKLKTSSKKSKPFKTQSKPSPGTLSCFAFMQGEGVSLENPEKFQDSKSKFFESTTGFTTVQNNKK
jgi:U4/U6 small nuclear ribonucleoprotein PRP31